MFLLVGTTLAITFSSKEDALSYIRNLKNNGEVINLKDFEINIISDKICIIDYETEEVIRCSIKYEIMYEGKIYSDCIFLPENTTLKEDEILMKEQARGELLSLFSKKNDIEYVAREY